MDLEGAGGYFRRTNAAWCDILELGQAFGWVPTGTGPPRGRLKSDCHGLYYGNDGQRFYARDARELADALERALTAISQGKSPRRPTRTAQATDYLEAELEGRERPKRGKVYVRQFGPEAASIRKFIKFCRAGSFRIY
jgi:hypothetical protein